MEPDGAARCGGRGSLDATRAVCSGSGKRETAAKAAQLKAQDALRKANESHDAALAKLGALRGAEARPTELQAQFPPWQLLLPKPAAAAADRLPTLMDCIIEAGRGAGGGGGGLAALSQWPPGVGGGGGGGAPAQLPAPGAVRGVLPGAGGGVGGGGGGGGAGGAAAGRLPTLSIIEARCGAGGGGGGLDALSQWPTAAFAKPLPVAGGVGGGGGGGAGRAAGGLREPAEGADAPRRARGAVSGAGGDDDADDGGGGGAGRAAGGLREPAEGAAGSAVRRVVRVVRGVDGGDGGGVGSASGGGSATGSASEGGAVDAPTRRVAAHGGGAATPAADDGGARLEGQPLKRQSDNDLQQPSKRNVGSGAEKAAAAAAAVSASGSNIAKPGYCSLLEAMMP